LSKCLESYIWCWLLLPWTWVCSAVVVPVDICSFMLFARLWKGNPRNFHPPIPVSGYLGKSLCIGSLSQALQDDGSPRTSSSIRIAEAWVLRLGRSKCHSASFVIECDVQHRTMLIEGERSTAALLQKGFTFVTKITSDRGRPSESTDSMSHLLEQHLSKCPR